MKYDNGTNCQASERSSGRVPVGKQYAVDDLDDSVTGRDVTSLDRRVIESYLTWNVII